MIAAALVLVAAPDSDFGRSLEFALETEGFAVDLHARIGRAFASPRAHEAACAVVDDAAVEDWRIAEEEFRRFGKPVVLLVGRIRSAPDLPRMANLTTLTKPFLGSPLIEAVREATADGR